MDITDVTYDPAVLFSVIHDNLASYLQPAAIFFSRYLPADLGIDLTVPAVYHGRQLSLVFHGKTRCDQVFLYLFNIPDTIMAFAVYDL